MNIAIVGSRNFIKQRKIYDYIQALPRPGTQLISGGAIGVDTVVKLAAEEFAIPITEFLPDWDKYDKSAGAIRNRQIVAAADKVVAFWDGKSKGTLITIELALEAAKPLEVIIDG